ncbi:hypothetical protein [Streptomyces fumanus]|uniref:Secreted protein n=1 Tax=Streptomyces fumanus TaxID=67302 RepID=A0A919DYJ3_9ACTN|nr:hypothetical protein [Streptomyces fumanus]GHE98454.1 hypothetical protein GCM10018772_23610 [Streptomyces fumanus]
MLYLLAATGSAMALALTPTAAQARAASTVAGFSYGDCYEAGGWYEYTADGQAGGYPKYDTDGSIEVIQYEDCNWIDKGILQYSGKKWQNGAWTTISWRQVPDPWVGGDGGGPGEIDYFVDFNDVRDVRFRVCNVHDGIVDGCGTVS